MISMRVRLILLTLLIAGCAEPGAERNPTELTRQAIDRAEARYDESRAVGHAWLQTRVRLENAKQALQDADFALARAEAERAVALADASIAQAQAEQSAWRDRFPSALSTSK